MAVNTGTTQRKTEAKAPKKRATQAKARQSTAKKAPPKRSASSAAAAKATARGLSVFGIEPYKPKKNEEYMSDDQLEHFRVILERWKESLMEEVDRTIHTLPLIHI